MKRLLILISLTVTAFSGLAAAEMLIRLKNGQVYRLPVQAEQVESITFQEDAAKGPSVSKAEAKQADATIIQVGPQRKFKTPSAAAQKAGNGAVIEIDAAIYPGDAAIWRQNDLTLRGVGGRPHLKAEDAAAEGKAIWVIKGNNVTVENIEFSEARVADKNGAGIRFEGTHLTIRNAYFHDNEMGILLGANPNSDVLIEGSEFAGNTVDYRRYKRLGHNIYIGAVRRFTLRNSYVHHAYIGHNVKTRARENYILYNRIMDESGGSSYLLDLAAGGQAYIIGNLFHQSPKNDNYVLISFAAERGGGDNPDQALYVVNNTFVNDDRDARFVQNHSAAPAKLINNLFVGPGEALEGPGETQNNLNTRKPRFKDRAAYDYRLVSGSPAIDKGVDPDAAADGFSLTPISQYVHPLGLEDRPRRRALDIGAYEFAGD